MFCVFSFLIAINKQIMLSTKIQKKHMFPSSNRLRICFLSVLQYTNGWQQPKNSDSDENNKPFFVYILFVIPFCCVFHLIRLPSKSRKTILSRWYVQCACNNGNFVLSFFLLLFYFYFMKRTILINKNVLLGDIDEMKIASHFFSSNVKVKLLSEKREKKKRRI